MAFALSKTLASWLPIKYYERPQGLRTLRNTMGASPTNADRDRISTVGKWWGLRG